MGVIAGRAPGAALRGQLRAPLPPPHLVGLGVAVEPRRAVVHVGVVGHLVAPGADVQAQSGLLDAFRQIGIWNSDNLCRGIQIISFRMVEDMEFVHVNQPLSMLENTPIHEIPVKIEFSKFILRVELSDGQQLTSMIGVRWQRDIINVHGYIRKIARSLSGEQVERLFR